MEPGTAPSRASQGDMGLRTIDAERMSCHISDDAADCIEALDAKDADDSQTWKS